MFGLTKREQRWKAEQQTAEVLAGLAAVAIRGVTDARIAEAQTDAAEGALAARVADLVAEVRELRQMLAPPSAVILTGAEVAEHFKRLRDGGA